MIETIILNYLKGSGITDVGTDVYMEVPENPPSEYIVIERTGGGETDLIEGGTFAIQSISKKRLSKAAEINEEVKEKMREIADFTDIYGCKLNSDYNFTNAATKEYRYQAVFLIYQ